MDATSKAIAETLRRWHERGEQNKVVPIERAFAYRREQKPAPRTHPPSGGPGRAA